MTTQARIIANRLNAQRSTGPKTPQGKAIVSQNALKHGLSARHDVIITESQEDFDLHRDSLLAELDPQGPMESILADRIVSLSWRLKRADLIQNQTIDAMHEKNTTNPLANIAKSFGLKGLALPQPETYDSNPDLTLGRIALKDFSNERVLDRLLMYERRIEHSLYKTILELQRLHLIRNLDPPINQLEPKAPRSAPVRPRRIPGVITDQNNTPAPPSHPERSRGVYSNLPAKRLNKHYYDQHIGANIEDSYFFENQSPIVNGEKPPTPEQPSLPPNQALIAQNKPNPQNPKTNATLATTKNYKQKPPHPTQENKPNQTRRRARGGPISPSWDAIRNTTYDTCPDALSRRAGTRYKPNQSRRRARGGGRMDPRFGPCL